MWSCGLIKDLKTRYYAILTNNEREVVVWLKIWKHDIVLYFLFQKQYVVVWLKIWKHDI